MRLRLAMVVALALVFAGAAGIMTAQDKQKPDKEKVRTLTGCLLKGDDAGEFNFKAKDGSTWDLDSELVKLDEHVGHTVTITGLIKDPKLHAMKEDVKEGAEKVVGKDAKEHGRLNVTKVVHVGNTCK